MDEMLHKRAIFLAERVATKLAMALPDADAAADAKALSQLLDRVTSRGQAGC